MAGIQPTSGIGPSMMPNPTGGIARAAQGQTQADFSRMLKAYVGQVEDKQQASYQALKDLISGRTQDIMPTVNAVAQADLSFKLLVGVRNKVIEAYRQTMNMQV